MKRVQAGEVSLGWREWGKGDTTVVFIHGNLASKDWIELATLHQPRSSHTSVTDEVMIAAGASISEGIPH